MILFLQLFLAHIIGDFFLQPTSWVRNKMEKKWWSPYLYNHTVIHFGLIILMMGGFSSWGIALAVALLHLVIDGIKLQFQHPATSRKWFFIDQFLHLLVIIIVVGWQGKIKIDWSLLKEPSILVLAAAVLFLLRPTSFIISIFISKWIPVSDATPNESLQNAGQWIGMMERLLIFTFVLIGKWEGVGFLLAAKSIFRFGDLRQGRETRLTEYVLIGTLMSFSIAIAAGLLVCPWLK